jgi:hypothetical protein
MNKRRRAWQLFQTDAPRSKSAPKVNLVDLVAYICLKNIGMAVKLPFAPAKRGIPYRDMPRTSFGVRRMLQNARSPNQSQAPQ